MTLTDKQRDVLLAVARNTRMFGLVEQFGEGAYDTIGELCDLRLAHGNGLDMGGNHWYGMTHEGRAVLREHGIPDAAWNVLAGYIAPVKGEQGTARDPRDPGIRATLAEELANGPLVTRREWDAGEGEQG